jgi:hypothetical protein
MAAAPNARRSVTKAVFYSNASQAQASVLATSSQLTHHNYVVWHYGFNITGALQ